MPYVPIGLPPGVVANGSEYEEKGRWRVANLIRWYNGHMRPVGGWQRFTSSPLADPARALLTWRDNDGNPYAAAGTASNLYYTDGALINDITPPDLTPGFVDQNKGLGYGAGIYNGGTYGTPRESDPGVVRSATTWSLDNFGRILLAMSLEDGRLFYWDPQAPTPTATEVMASGTTAVPLNNRGMIVTDERIVVLLGAGGNPRLIQWCNQGDFTNWDVTESTTSGDLQIHSNGLIQSACRMPGTNLIFTDTDVHSLTYVNYPYIYGIQRIGSACGIISPHAFAATHNFCVWMGDLNFFIYNGIVSPLPCEVGRGVFDNLNQDQASKVIGGVNSHYNEVWFFFPSLDSIENDSYVFWNFKENYWGLGIGALSRTAWVNREVWDTPIAAGSDKMLYQHEDGWTAAGASRVNMVNAESGPIDIGNGDNTQRIRQILTDTNVGEGQVNLSFKTKQTPNGAEESWGPFQIRDDGYTDARFSGRQAKIRLDLSQDGLFQFGTIRLDTVLGGKR